MKVVHPAWRARAGFIVILFFYLSACGGGAGEALVQNQNTINTGQPVSGQEMLQCRNDQPQTSEPCAQPPGNTQGTGGVATGGITISQENAAAVTAVVLDTLMPLYEFAGNDNIATNTITAMQLSADHRHNKVSLWQLTERQLIRLAQQDQLVPPGTPIMLAIQVEPPTCEDNSGTVNVTEDSGNISLEFSSCRIDDMLLDGRITISGLQSNGDSPGNPTSDWQVSADFAFQGLQMRAGDTVVSFDGGTLTAEIENDARNLRRTGQITINAQLNIIVSDGITNSLRSGFRMIYVYDVNTSTTTLRFDGSLQRGASELNLLEIRTNPDAPLILNPEMGMLAPSGTRQGPYRDGELLIRSNDQSRVLMKVLSASSVQLELNGPGGTVLDPISWDELLASL